MNRSIIQIRIDDPLRVARPPGFSRGSRRYQFMKQLTKDLAVMGQLLGDKHRLTRSSVGQITQHLSSIVQFAPANPEDDQQSCGGVDGRPDPRLPVLIFNVCVAVRTFLFFSKVHNSTRWASVNCSDVSRPESTRAQCSPARRITIRCNQAMNSSYHPFVGLFNI